MTAEFGFELQWSWELSIVSAALIAVEALVEVGEIVYEEVNKQH